MTRFTLVAIVTSLLCGIAGDAQAALRWTTYASGLSAPVGFVQSPTDPNVQFVVEQRGRIRVVRNGVVLPTDFLTLTGIVSNGGEQGLLGLAFAPDYATSGRFFVHFTNAIGDNVVARFKRSADPLVADASSRFDLHWGGAGGPTSIVYAVRSNHNGGQLAFGPDGYLYIAIGDRGSNGTAFDNSQTPTVLPGKMLRIDVNVADSHPSGYQVPPDNPFVGGGPVGVLPEVWSFGLRNPWRYSFDNPALGGTGALIISDVGQNNWEEIDYEPANRGGRNYGWRNREGLHPAPTSTTPAFLPFTDPIFEYDHGVGVAVIGGYVYRGQALGSTYRGRYFFGDLLGRVFSLRLTIDSMTGEATASDLLEHTAELGGTGGDLISSFGVDAAGELYVLNYTSGRVMKVLGSAAITSPAPGTTLPGRSATFTWTSDAAASTMWLDVGTTVGGSQIYGATQGLLLSRTVTGLPVDGSPVYVRLWALTAAGWSYTDYTYAAVLVVPAGMLAPAPGSTLTETVVTFSWTGGSGVNQIWLDVGTSPGGNQIYGGTQGASLSRTIGIPIDGHTVYVRLWSLTSEDWRFTDYTYAAASPVPAGMLSPDPGTVLAGSTVNFTWTRGTGVNQIWLDVGTSPGGNQIYGGTQGASLSRTVTGIPTDGHTIYARLWSLTSAGWGLTDYTYTAATPIPAGMLSPNPGTVLAGSTVNFTWTRGTGVNQIWLDVGTSSGGNQIYGGTQGVSLSRTVTGIPTDGHTVYARLWSLTSAGWRFTDYTYDTQ